MREIAAFPQVTLKELSLLITDGSHFSPAPQPMGVAIANVKDLRDGYIDLDSCTRISDSAYEQLVASGCTINPGDVLFSKDGTIGKVVVYEQPDTIAALSSICIIRPRSEFSNRFLGQALQSVAFGKQVAAAISGSALRRLVLREITRLTVPAPPPAEQRLIAEILDVVDEAVRTTEQLIAKLEQMKQGVLHDLLTKGIDANGKPISPVRLKDSPLGPIRADWDVAPLRAYGSVDRPYLKTGPFGSSLKQAHWRATGVPVITIGSLGEGVITEAELLHVSEPTARSLAGYAVVPGDIVFSRVADVGRSAVVRESERGWIISSNLMWLSVDRRRAVPEFLQANLAGNTGVRRQIRKLVNSAGRDVANAATMNAVLFPWPPFDEQVRIARVLRATDSRIDRERTVLLKLGLLKQGLMDDLLTGRVRVTGLLEGDAA